ncbi:unnamed protein product [Bubo scandiacus]
MLPAGRGRGQCFAPGTVGGAVGGASPPPPPPPPLTPSPPQRCRPRLWPLPPPWRVPPAPPNPPLPPLWGARGGPPLAAYALPGPGPQRLLLAPDMQARLPSGEVGTPILYKRGNVVHLVAAGGQHPLLGPPAQVTLLAPVAPSPAPAGVPPPGPPQPPTIGLPIAATQGKAPMGAPPPPRTPPRCGGAPLTPLFPLTAPPVPAAPPVAAAVAPRGLPRHLPLSPPREEPEGPGGPAPPSTHPPPAAPRRQPPPPPRSPFYLESLEAKRGRGRAERLERLLRLNELRCGLAPVYGSEVLGLCTLPPQRPPGAAARPRRPRPPQRLRQLQPLLDRYGGDPRCWGGAGGRGGQISAAPPLAPAARAQLEQRLREELTPRGRALHRVLRSMRTHFPDLRLIQYDCGKLQTLDVLLRRLKAGAHRVLIFTQMTRMLDVLERFLTYHGHIYLRLDGSTRVEQRQALMERFNADKRIFCFILSTRSGGVGVNLAGADTVVFYDSDWNPTMDAQAQDRCHRIGQTRDVHIYRLISERTVEENILKKANQKRMLGDMAIEGGNFTTAYFKQQTIRELFDMAPEEPGRREPDRDKEKEKEREKEKEKERDGDVPPDEDEDPAATRRTHILEQALCGAEDPEDIRAASQAQAERVAALAEFSESLSPEEERGGPEPEEELSKAEQEIAALVEQLTPIERYAMNFLEASLEDVSREELKQAEEQVEAARKDIDQAKGGGPRGDVTGGPADVTSQHGDTQHPPGAITRRHASPCRHRATGPGRRRHRVATGPGCHRVTATPADDVTGAPGDNDDGDNDVPGDNVATAADATDAATTAASTRHPRRQRR